MPHFSWFLDYLCTTVFSDISITGYLAWCCWKCVCVWSYLFKNCCSRSSIFIYDQFIYGSETGTGRHCKTYASKPAWYRDQSHIRSTFPHRISLGDRRRGICNTYRKNSMCPDWFYHTYKTRSVDKNFF